MAVEAYGSRHARTNNFLTAAVLILLGAWFAYDGWFSEAYRQKNTTPDGQPNVDLKLNRYSPFVLVPIGLYFLVLGLQTTGKKISADEKGLTLANGKTINYDQIQAIDKRNFEKQGYFLIQYEEGGQGKNVKLYDRQYDGLGLVLDEVVKRTGAEPQQS